VAATVTAKDQQWISQLAELRRSLEEAGGSSINDVPYLKDWIYVITPKGDVIDLRTGASPIDFAYRIHTELGHRYAGAKVSGRVVSANYELKNGDIVELLPTRGKRGPSPDWLSMSKDDEGHSRPVFARTIQARHKIRAWLRKNRPDMLGTDTQKPAPSGAVLAGDRGDARHGGRHATHAGSGKTSPNKC
jgi:GTP pyrophosphokinase